MKRICKRATWQQQLAKIALSEYFGIAVPYSNRFGQFPRISS